LKYIWRDKKQKSMNFNYCEIKFDFIVNKTACVIPIKQFIIFSNFGREIEVHKSQMFHQILELKTKQYLGAVEDSYSSWIDHCFRWVEYYSALYRVLSNLVEIVIVFK